MYVARLLYYLDQSGLLTAVQHAYTLKGSSEYDSWTIRQCPLLFFLDLSVCQGNVYQRSWPPSTRLMDACGAGVVRKHCSGGFKKPWCLSMQATSIIRCLCESKYGWQVETEMPCSLLSKRDCRPLSSSMSYCRPACQSSSRKGRSYKMNPGLPPHLSPKVEESIQGSSPRRKTLRTVRLLAAFTDIYRVIIAFPVSPDKAA